MTRRERTRWDEDNELALNPWAFFVVAVVISAIVVPIVLVSLFRWVAPRDADVIRPKNSAVAVNENCSSCRTFAAAYQYVITTGGPVYLSPEGTAEVEPSGARLRP